MRIRIAYFSFTGNVRRLVADLRSLLESRNELVLEEIRPVRPRGYWSWLALSFLPGSRVAVEPRREAGLDCDLLILVFPKWTFSCPPLNGWLKNLDPSAAPPVALLLVYGGFDERRFLDSLVRRLRRRGLKLVAADKVRRHLIQSECHLDSLREWVMRIQNTIGR